MVILLIFIPCSALVMIGNLVYFRYVIPTLEKNGFGNESGNVIPSALPSTQSKQMKQYPHILDEDNLKPWFYSYVKNQGVSVNLLQFNGHF